MKITKFIVSSLLLFTLSACTLQNTFPAPEEVKDSKKVASELEKQVLSKGIRFGDPAKREDPLTLTAQALQPAIDKWLEEGIANGTLNEWGELADSPPPTEQQLLDPVTKKPNTKYEWIVRRHSDKLFEWSRQVNSGEVK